MYSINVQYVTLRFVDQPYHQTIFILRSGCNAYAFLDKFQSLAVTLLVALVAYLLYLSSTHTGRFRVDTYVLCSYAFIG